MQSAKRGTERCLASMPFTKATCKATPQSLRTYATRTNSPLQSRLSSQPTHQRTLCAFLYPPHAYLRSAQWQPLTSPLKITNTRSFSISQVQHKESTVQGTIGEGAQGVAAEAERAEEMLVAPDHLDEAELHIYNKLNAELEPTKLEVQDISGGCGSMYGIEIASEKFRGLSMVKQQKLVNQILAEEIKGWHGVQLRTRVP